MSSLLRSSSESHFILQKNKIEILNNNIKSLKIPIKNKEYQFKRRISSIKSPKIILKKDSSGEKHITCPIKHKSFINNNFDNDNANKFKTNLLNVMMLNCSYSRFLNEKFSKKISEIYEQLQSLRRKITYLEHKYSLNVENLKVYLKLETIIDDLDKILLLEHVINKIDICEEFQKEAEVQINELDNIIKKLHVDSKLYKQVKTFKAMLIYIKSSIDLNVEVFNLFQRSLFHKLQNFIIDYLDNKIFWFQKYNNPHTLNFIENFFKLKNDYIKSISSPNNASFESSNNFNSSIDLNCSGVSNIELNINVDELHHFHKIFFKAIYDIIIFDIALSHPDISSSCENNFIDPKESSESLIPTKLAKNETFWKFRHLSEKFILSKNKKICLGLKSYFNTKLITWRYLYIKYSLTKKHVCRLCEQSFYLNDFFFHSRYCMQSKIYIKSMLDLKTKINTALQNLKIYKEATKSLHPIPCQKPSVKEFNQRSIMKPNSLVIKSSENLLKSFDADYVNPLVTSNGRFINSQPPLDNLIAIIKRELTKTLENYEKMPFRLISLNKTIHFLSNLIFNQTLEVEKNEKLCEIYYELIYVLSSKNKIIEMMLFDKTEQDIITNTNTRLQRKFKSTKEHVNLFFSKVNNTKNNTPKKVRSNVKAGTQFLAGSSSNFRKFTTLNVSVDTTMTPLVKKRTLDINNSSNNNYSNHINSPSLFVKRNENPYLNNDYLQFENNVFKFDKNEFVEMKKKTSFNCSSSRKNSFTTKNTFKIEINKTIREKADDYLNEIVESPLASRPSEIKFGSSQANDQFDLDDPINAINHISDELLQSKKQSCSKAIINHINNNNSSYEDSVAGENSQISSYEGEAEFEEETKIQSPECFAEVKDKWFSSSRLNTVDDLSDLMQCIKIEDMACPSKSRLKFDVDDLGAIDDVDSEDDSEDKKQELQELFVTDFEHVINLGSGSYGKVDLVKKKNTGELYALKTVNIKDKNIEKLLINETLILNEVSCECLVKCFYIFSDETNYYYVMEFIGGGSLTKLISEFNLSNEVVKILVAEMAIALEYLHNKKIYHRDVKPENILITNTGHFKLTDFGLSVGHYFECPFVISSEEFDKKIKIIEVDAKSKNEETSIFGTSNFVSPEIIMGEPENGQGDYWSLGVIIYLIFTRVMPFETKESLNDKYKLFDNILEYKINWDKLKTSSINSDLFDLVKGFLTYDKNKRLCQLEKIKNHKFFKGFKWENITNTKSPLKLYAAKNIKSINEVIRLNSEMEKKLESEKNKQTYKKKLTFASIKFDNLNEQNNNLIKKIIESKDINIEMCFDD